MADTTTKVEEVVENVTHTDTEVKKPVAAAADGEVTAAQTNGKATVDVIEDVKTEDIKAGKSEDSKDTAAEPKDDAQSNGDKEDDGNTHSPDNKRKDTNDHYRDGNKRSRGGGGRGRGGRGRGGRGNFAAKNANIVRTFDDQPESNDPVEIRRQVEFYFSDSNLPIDGYLLGMVEASKNLPVDLRTIHNFKRMRHFQPFSAVVEAVKASEVLDVEERDNTAYVTRKIPLGAKFVLNTSENKKLLTTDTMERSIYAKGFGDETKSTHLDIEELFAPYGPTNSIRLRRTENGDFKGSVFVEFADVPTQQRFLELDVKPTWGEDEKELQIMSKQAYVDKKHDAILNGDTRPRSPRRSNYRGHGGNKRGGRDGGLRNHRYSDKRDRSRSPGRDDWKQRRDRDQRNGNRDDKRGRGRGGRGRGGRDRDDRRRRDDEDDEERSRSRSPQRKDEGGKGADEPLPTRAEAEALREQQVKDSNGAADADAAAEKAEGGSKKRAREEDDDGAAEGGEMKKVRETEVDA